MRIFLWAISALSLASLVSAWDDNGHRTINQLALESLPANYPAFVRETAAVKRIGYLASAPDRWRNVDPWLRQAGPSWTDHFLDLEQLPAAGIDPLTVPSLRYDFAVAFAAGRAAHAANFPVIDPARNADGTRQWPGFAPWAITEWVHKLRSAFGCLKAFEEMGGTAEEIANARTDVIQMMGVLGHYVADCAQPLHTTDNFNGWAGPNPQGYTTWRGLHSWVDGGFIAKAGLSAAGLKSQTKVPPALLQGPRADGRDPLFVAVMEWFIRQHAQVEPLYQLEKAGKLGHGDQPITPEALAFFQSRLLSGSEMLASLWITAWQSAPIDTYLRGQLARRQGLKASDQP